MFFKDNLCHFNKFKEFNILEKKKKKGKKEKIFNEYNGD